MEVIKRNLTNNNINICVVFDGKFEQANIIKKYYSNLEKEINSQGGIAQKKIKIWLEDVNYFNENKISHKDFFETNKSFDFVLMNGDEDFLSTLDGSEEFSQEIDSVLFHGRNLVWINEHYKYFKYKYSLETFSSAGGYKAVQDLFPSYKITALVHDSKKSRQKEFEEAGFNLLFYEELGEVKSSLDNYFKQQSKKDLFYLGLTNLSPEFEKRKDFTEFLDRKIDLYEEPLKSFFAHGEGEFFDGRGDFYTEAKSKLTSKHNVKNKSIHCYAPLDYLVYMRSQDILKNLDKNLPSWELSQIDSKLFPASIITLLQDLFANSKDKFESRNEFLKESIRRINNIDGTKGIHRGDFGNMSFQDYQMTTQGKFTLDLSLGKDGQTVKERMSRYQKIDWNSEKKESIKPVTYTYFDIINIRDISIEEGTFKIQFFLDMTSKNSNPIETLTFNNLDLQNPLKKKVIKEQEMEEGFKFIRYLIEGKFDFFPVVENYPFDEQLVFISYALTDEEKYGILQPLPVEDLDKEFRLEGWRIKDTRSGVFRRKVNFNPFLGEDGMIKIEKENRVGWLIKRSSSMTLLKVLIPISFLFGVVMYSAAMPSQDIGRAAELLTVTFLASIALYFSSERPQPLTMTIIDIIFAGFYAITGIVSMLIFVLDFYPNIHSMLAGYISFVVPLGSAMMFLYLLKRIKSRKYAPKMLSSDEN